MYAAVDIGATNTRILITNTLEPADTEDIVIFSTSQDYQEGLSQIVECLKNTKVNAVGVSFAGGVSADGNVIGSTNLPLWDTHNLRLDIENELQCSVYVDNDALNSARGEAIYGEHEFNEFIYLAWGTGLGAAIVKMDSGRVIAYRPENRELLYELEKDLGGVDCERKYGKPMSQLSNGEWDDVMTNMHMALMKLSGSEDWGKTIFVFGGGVSEKQKDRIKNLNITGTQIKVSQLAERSGLYGALALIRQREVL